MTADHSTIGSSVLRPQSWNKYSYVESDPINFKDPRGLFIRSADSDDGEDDEGDEGDDGFSGYPIFGGGPGNAFRSPSPYERASNRLQRAEDALDNRTNFSPNCQGDIAALSQAFAASPGGTTFTANDVAERAAGLYVQNGVGSTLPISALYGPGAEAAGRAAQAIADRDFGPGQTIGNEFARNPSGLTAKTVLFGNTVFVNPGLIGASLVGNEALLFHEALHAIGLVDTTIQGALGIKVDPNNTAKITSKLRGDCFGGKENY